MREGDLIDDRYRVEKKLGQGGMGEVFRGHDSKMNKAVAIKVLFPNTPDQVIKRFHTEAKALGSLNHPNVMTVLDFGQAKNGQLFLVMDYIKGDSLASLIEKRGVQTFFDVLPIFEKICRGLRFAHMNSVLHRDIKPSNVMLANDRTLDDSVKLVDFGLAKMAEQDHHLTKTGAAMGSPPYMSPESVHGKEVDERSDIYSLGCTFFEMMVAQPPFTGDTQFHTMMAQLNRLAPTLSEISGKEYEEEVEEFIRKCIKKNPVDRFQNMDEVIAELERVKNVLIEKRQSSMGALASGVYASGAFIAEKVRKANRMTLMGLLICVPIAFIAFVAFVVDYVKHRTNVQPEKRDEKVLLKVAESLNPADVTKDIEDLSSHRKQFKKGATVGLDSNSQAKVCTLSGKLTDQEVEQEVMPYSSLKVFQFQNLEVSDSAYKRLLQLPIESLTLRYIDVTDGLISSIGEMPSLANLRIIGCKNLPQDVIARFKDLKKLRNMEFDKNNEIANLGVSISKLKTLQGIQLGAVKLNRDDVRSLSENLHPAMLNFVACHLSEDAFDDLNLSKKCSYFTAADIPLTEHQVAMIAEMPDVMVLDLQKTPMNDDWLQFFSHSKTLKTINVPFTSVTDKGGNLLKKSVPTLEQVVTGSAKPNAEKLLEGPPEF